MEKKSTKERIVLAALDLFAEKGYDGVGVDQIAETVGIKGPSLYHHFKSKEDILNAIIDINEVHCNLNCCAVENVRKFPKSAEELINISLERVEFTIHDPQIKKCRMFFTKEQFRNKKIRELTTKHFMTGLEELYRVIFEHMMADGTIVEEDPRMLAFEFVAPVTMLIHQIDREPEKEEEIMDKMKAFMKHFIKNYGK